MAKEKEIGLNVDFVGADGKIETKS